MNSTMGNSRVPVIEISPFLTDTAMGKQKVVEEVARACEEIGFLVISGHGIPATLIREVNSVAKQFFDMPRERKKGYTTKTPGMGYLPPEGESLAASLDMKAPTDLKESLNLGIGADQDPWPDVPPQLKPICLEYAGQVKALAETIMHIFALALDLPEDFFDDKIDRPRAILRLLHYPPVEKAPQAGQFRASAHTDYGTITVLWSEKIRGLQVRTRSGEWIDVESVPDAFVVNIGDIMARWTNDRWISTLHRVVVPANEEQRSGSRQSIVFFHNPNPDAVIACLESCCSPQNPAKYEPIKTSDFYDMKANKSLGLEKK
jgi:isopenicillin N synthase-like dioxygenase